MAPPIGAQRVVQAICNGHLAIITEPGASPFTVMDVASSLIIHLCVLKKINF